MLDNADWITPTEAERLVAARMRLSDGCDEVRAALEDWINDDRVLMQAAEVIHWESRYHRRYLADFEPEPPICPSSEHLA